MAAAAAATRNNEQKTCRHLDGVNVDVDFGFVIIELAGAFGLFCNDRKRTPERSF
jgi:hypothetical protein